MRGAFTGHRFLHRVTECTRVESGEQVLPAAQQDGTHRQVQVVDEFFAQVLANRGHAAANAHVTGARGLASPRQRGMDALPVTKWNTVPPVMASGARA